jgi:SdpC family antimicrobial peptide
MRRTARYAITVSALAAVGVGIGIGPALADTGARARHTKAPSYTDRDVTSLLAFGAGRIAQQHPATLKALGETPRSTSAQQVVELTAALNKVDPAYHTVVTQGLQSGDPYQVQSALKAYGQDVKQLAAAKGTEINPNGSWFVWTDNALVQTGTVATTVAAVAEVGAVTVVAYAHNDDQSQFAQESIAANVAGAL